MAFVTKYRIEFGDNLLVTWMIDIQKNGYAGDINYMVSSGNPLKIEFYGDDDILNQNILGSKASFEVISMNNFQYEELFTSEHFEFKVIIKKNASLYWSGFILVNNFSEPYNCPPYPVTLTATDGLGLLSDFKFVDLAYTARETAAKMIYDILSLVSITTFQEYVNVYESTMADTIDDSPLDQCEIDPYLFNENDCYESLESILKSFNAGIRQDYDGKIKIYRFKELTHSTMFGREFTDATTKSSVTKVPGKYLNRILIPSSYRDVEGGSKLTIPAVKTMYVSQDYKFKGSFFDNHDFPRDKFTLNGGTGAYECAKWLSSAGTLTNYISFNVLGEGDNGIIINSPFDPIPPTHYIYQTINIITTAYTTAVKLTISGVTFDYTESAGARVYVKLINTNGVNTRYFDGTTWNAADSFINNAGIPAVKADTYGPSLKYSTVTFSVAGIPYTGTLTLRLYAGSSTGSNVSSCTKALQVFSVDANGIIIEGIGYVITNAVNGQVVEKEYILGDGYGFENDHLQYAGALTVSGVPSSKSWHTMIAGVSEAEDVPLIEVIAGEVGAQYIRTKHLIDMPVLETNAANILTPIGTLIDILNPSPDNILTGWVNDNYGTFTSVGTEITSAISAVMLATAHANELLSLTDGDVVWFEGDLKIISGDLPIVRMYPTGAGSAPYQFLAEGNNKLIFVAPDTDTYRFYIGEVADPLDFTLSNVKIKLKVRKMGITRGSYDVKNRRWDLSLTELL